MRKEPKVLHLTLSKKPFEVMVTGEKNEEFRFASKWMLSRLYNKDGSLKHYDYVKFVNGYGADKPYFVTPYLGFREIGNNNKVHKYSNGLVVNEANYDVEIAIKLGDVIYNLHEHPDINNFYKNNLAGIV